MAETKPHQKLDCAGYSFKGYNTKEGYFEPEGYDEKGHIVLLLNPGWS